MILDEIVNNKVKELAVTKRLVPLNEIQKIAAEQPPSIDFVHAFKKNQICIIAEVKKASPSRGVIRADFHPVEIAETYAANHVAAISVLTESKYFQGSLDHLRSIKSVLRGQVPILRKDFIFDVYQVYESKATGADAILLIAALLQPTQLRELLQLSRELGMSCLVETHNANEVAMALQCEALIIGINNRDLTTFETDINTTLRLRPMIPAGHIIVSESGIQSRNDIYLLRQNGVDAVLVGERLMSAPDIALALRELQ